MRFTNEMALTSPYGLVDDPLMAQLQAHFTDAQIVELVVVIMFDVGWAKMLFTMDWVEKETYCYYRHPAK